METGYDHKDSRRAEGQNGKVRPVRATKGDRSRTRGKTTQRDWKSRADGGRAPRVQRDTGSWRAWVGRSIHEDPFVHNYYVTWDNQPLEEGLVIAIEPVSSAGSGKSVERADGWTVETAGGAPYAHFEHTIVIARGRPLVLTK